MFKTTRRTLVSEPNSVLADMFEFADDSANVGAKNEENGALFIDRDPKYFSVVLNYLRNKKVEMNKDIDLNYLMEEAKFYGIQGMVEILEKDQQEKKRRTDKCKRRLIMFVIQGSNINMDLRELEILSLISKSHKLFNSR